MIELPRAQIRDPEIDIDGGGRRKQGDRPLQTRPGAGPVAAIAQHAGKEDVTLACGGIQRDALLQLRPGAILLAAVPERHAEMVVRLGRGRLQRDRPFQLADGSREVSLLPQREAEERVRLCILVVELQRLLETLPRVGKIAVRERLLRLPIQIVRRFRGGGIRC